MMRASTLLFGATLIVGFRDHSPVCDARQSRASTARMARFKLNRNYFELLLAKAQEMFAIARAAN
jgi:hypothetical protein